MDNTVKKLALALWTTTLTTILTATIMKTSLSRYLLNILIKTFFLSSLISVIAMMSKNAKEHRGLEGKEGDFIEYMVEIAWILFLSASTLPIYFNLLKPVRNSPLISLLTFITLPLAVAIMVRILSGGNNNWFSFYLGTGVFLTTLVYFYLIFRKDIK